MRGVFAAQLLLLRGSLTEHTLHNLLMAFPSKHWGHALLSQFGNSGCPELELLTGCKPCSHSFSGGRAIISPDKHSTALGQPGQPRSNLLRNKGRYQGLASRSSSMQSMVSLLFITLSESAEGSSHSNNEF